MLLNRHYYKIIFFFALLASIFAVIQSLRVTPLVDYAYQIENAYRIYSGEIPYKDFFLVLPPGTYLLTALSMIPTQGYTHLGHMLLIILETFAAVVLIGYILEKIGNDKSINLTLLILTLATGHVIYPWASYDLDTVLFILVSLAIWMRFWAKHNPLIFIFLGVMFSFPTYFKQNIGAIYAVSMVALYGLAWIRFRNQKILQDMIGIIIGLVFSYGVFFLWLSANGIVEQFIYQLFIFPSKVKEPFVAIMNILAAYKVYGIILVLHSPYIFLLFIPLVIKRIRKYWTIFVSIISIIFFGYHSVFQLENSIYFHTPFLLSWMSVYVCIGISIGIFVIRARSVNQFFQTVFPVVLLVACHATYLSHIPIHASYGIWSLYIIMLASCIRVIRLVIPFFPIKIFILSFVIFLSSILVRYNLQFSFFGNINLTGEPTFGTRKELQGLATRGTWLADMERMFEYVEKQIPKSDIVAFFPGEDPFFSITKRKNPLPFVQFQMGTYPMFISERQTLDTLLAANVEWIIVKEEPQLMKFGFVFLSNPYFHIQESYRIVNQIPKYDIWKRI